MRHKIDIGWNVSEYDAKQILQLLSLTKKAQDILLALLTLIRAFVWVRASNARESGFARKLSMREWVLRVSVACSVLTSYSVVIGLQWASQCILSSHIWTEKSLLQNYLIIELKIFQISHILHHAKYQNCHILCDFYLRKPSEIRLHISISYYATICSKSDL